MKDEDFIKLDFSNLRRYLSGLDITTSTLTNELNNQKLKQERLEILTQVIESAIVKITATEGKINSIFSDLSQTKESFMSQSNKIISIENSFELMKADFTAFQEKLNSRDKGLVNTCEWLTEKVSNLTEGLNVLSENVSSKKRPSVHHQIEMSLESIKKYNAPYLQTSDIQDDKQVITSNEDIVLSKIKMLDDKFQKEIQELRSSVVAMKSEIVITNSIDKNIVHAYSNQIVSGNGELQIISANESVNKELDAEISNSELKQSPKIDIPALKFNEIEHTLEKKELGSQSKTSRIAGTIQGQIDSKHTSSINLDQPHQAQEQIIETEVYNTSKSNHRSKLELSQVQNSNLKPTNPFTKSSISGGYGYDSNAKLAFVQYEGEQTQLYNFINELSGNVRHHNQLFKTFIEDQIKIQKDNERKFVECKLHLNRLFENKKEIVPQHFNEVMEESDNLEAVSIKAKEKMKKKFSSKKENLVIDTSSLNISVVEGMIRVSASKFEKILYEKFDNLETRLRKMKDSILSESEISELVRTKSQHIIDLYMKIEIQKINESISEMKSDLKSSAPMDGFNEARTTRVESSANSNSLNKLIGKYETLEQVVSTNKRKIDEITNQLEVGLVDINYEVIPLLKERKTDFKGISKNYFRMGSAIMKSLIEKTESMESKQEVMISLITDRLMLKLGSENQKLLLELDGNMRKTLIPIEDKLNTKASFNEIEQHDKEILNLITKEISKKLDKTDLNRQTNQLHRKIDLIENKLTKTFVDSLIEFQQEDKPLILKSSKVAFKTGLMKCASCDHPLDNSLADNSTKFKNSQRYNNSFVNLATDAPSSSIASIQHQARKMNIGSYSKFLEMSDPVTIKKEIFEGSQTQMLDHPLFNATKKGKNNILSPLNQSKNGLDYVVSIKKKMHKQTMSMDYSTFQGVSVQKNAKFI